MWSKRRRKAPPNLAAELLEEGLVVPAEEDGQLTYQLTIEGARLARELLDESPSARAYLRRLREGAAQ